jgi:Mor family transcriptional regulator
MAREDLTIILRQEVLNAAVCLGVHPQLASDLAAQVEDRMRLRASGKDLQYIGLLDRRERAEKIRAEFNGANLGELARRYNLTVRRVRQILAVSSL